MKISEVHHEDLVIDAIEAGLKIGDDVYDPCRGSVFAFKTEEQAAAFAKFAVAQGFVPNADCFRDRKPYQKLTKHVGWYSRGFRFSIHLYERAAKKKAAKKAR